MCGLAGLMLPAGSATVEADLAAMLRVMRHRGPDGTGTYVTPDHRFQAGFTRLAIIDREGSDQPLIRADGETVLLGNGEIYTYRELRSELQARGQVFRTAGDMETALLGHAVWGDDFVHHLNGMYAIALYDRRAGALTLVRDRLGIKPLYWARLPGGGILFASEIKALFASGLVSAEIDPAQVGPWLGHGYVPAPATLFRGVFSLPPGTRMQVAADGTIRTERYWRPAPAGGLPADAQGLRETLLARIDDSVGLHLRADVPVGAMLSGGLDSGLLVALAARRLDRPLRTYTVRFEGAGVDETPLAALVAERYGTDHTRFDLSCARCADLLPALVWHADAPISDASLLPNYLINQVIGAETRVVLNGTGGDELFAGYGRYFPLAVERRWLRLPAPLRRAAERLIARRDPLLAWKLGRAAKRAADRGGYLFDHSTQFPPPLLAALGWRGGPAAPAQRAALPGGDVEPDTAQLIAELDTYLPEDLLTLLDRTTMAHSVEGRVPLLDHRVVEAALAIPAAIRTPGGRQKAFERTLAAPLLPAAILEAPKQGFASPVPAWFESGGLAAPTRRLLTRPAALARGWWSAEGVDGLLADPRRHAFRLYALLVLELTHVIHVEGRFETAPAASLAEIADAA